MDGLDEDGHGTHVRPHCVLRVSVSMAGCGVAVFCYILLLSCWGMCGCVCAGCVGVKVTGILLGSLAGDTENEYKYRGVAPDAKVAFMDLGKGDNGLAHYTEMEILLDEPYLSTGKTHLNDPP